MRVPPDLPPRLPPRVETPTPLTEAISPETAEWEAAADALDALRSPGADDSDDRHHHPRDDDARRQRPHADECDEEEDPPTGEQTLGRRPYLSNGFWVLPEPHLALRPASAPGRSPLLPAAAAVLAADQPGHRAARKGPDDGDDDARREHPAGNEEGAADE